MEELLNKLIEKGWKPYQLNTIEKSERKTEFWFVFTTIYNEKSDVFTIRELVSKESWLWQFVCENGYIREIETDWLEIRNWNNPRHWIVESALTDEDKLEDFILSNIKLD